jgi:hypothetical protein
MRRKGLFVVILFIVRASLSCLSQQTDVPEFAILGGYSYLSAPSLNLTQRGFDSELGVNVRSWLALGGDFSYNSGHSSLLPTQLSSSAQASLAPILPHLPPGFILAVPYNSATYTYEAGPQFNYRRLRKITFFVRPSLGAIHAKFTARPDNPLLEKIVAGLTGPTLGKSDTAVFYGVGGGIIWEVTPHFGIGVASDFVHYNFFSDLLDGGRNSVRITVGTKFGFGKNIIK